MMNKEQEDALKNEIIDDQDSFEQHFKEQERKERIIHFAELALNGLISHYGAANPKSQAKLAFEVALAMYDQELEIFDK